MKYLTFLLSSILLCSCEHDDAQSADSYQIRSHSPGAKLVKESIEAHGGIENWRSNGLLQFRWKYHMTDKGRVVNSLQTVNPNTLAVAHTSADGTVQFGMKDGTAWILPPDATFSPPPRFWSLTPTYFIGIPFVFDDAGASFDLLEESIDFHGIAYDQVKVSYSSESGDSPDDYYVLLIDPDTKLVRAAYYTVTHPLVFEGGTPIEKLITLDNLTEHSGLKLAGGHVTHSMTDGVIGKQIRHTEVSEVRFVPKDSVDLNIPDGAKRL